MKKRIVTCLTAVLAGAVCAAGGLEFDAGVDARFRYDWKGRPLRYQNNRTAAAATDPHDTRYQDYYRMRTRFWGEMSYENVTLYSRLANEFRGYHNAAPQNKFPDELFIDNLYFEIRDICGERLSLRAGRQDLNYGAGRVISDGMAGDGSRTASFDAVKAIARIDEKRKLDLVAVWQRPEDHWTLGNARYDLTKYQTSDGGNAMTERALMAYYSDNAFEGVPFELYYIYKDETRWLASNGKRLPERRYSTIGARVVPHLSEKWSAEGEVAVQAGETGRGAAGGRRDILTWMGYGGVTYTETEFGWKPYVTAAVLVLSGDDDRFDDPAARGKDTGWNTLFNRSTWFSELMSGEFATLRWSNLVYPHLEAGVCPAKDHRALVQGGPHYAYRHDNANGDAYRGLFLMARYDFPLLRPAAERRGGVRGTLLAEVIEAGGYYADAGTAYCLRFELNAKF